MIATLSLVAAIAAVTGDGQAQTNAGKAASAHPIIEGCIVKVIHEVEVPAEEQGVLRSIEVKEGDEVQKNRFLGKISSDKAEMQRRVALAELEKATKEAENDVKERYAVASYNVSKQDLEQAMAANTKVGDAVNQADIRKRWLQAESARLQIEQAQLDQDVAKATKQVKHVELEASELEIERRKIKSPLDGLVVQIKKQEGEWVNPGDTVMVVLHMQHLFVEGYVNAANWDPGQIDGRRVVVTVSVAGRPVEFDGHVAFVNPKIEGDGSYLVRAEVENEQDPVTFKWTLRPGMRPTMDVRPERFIEGLTGAKP